MSNTITVLIVLHPSLYCIGELILYNFKYYNAHVRITRKESILHDDDGIPLFLLPCWPSFRWGAQQEGSRDSSCVPSRTYVHDVHHEQQGWKGKNGFSFCPSYHCARRRRAWWGVISSAAGAAPPRRTASSNKMWGSPFHPQHSTVLPLPLAEWNGYSITKSIDSCNVSSQFFYFLIELKLLVYKTKTMTRTHNYFPHRQYYTEWQSSNIGKNNI